jgi:hypothetical protein
MQAESARALIQVFDVDCYEFRTKTGSPSNGPRPASMREESEPENAQLLSDGIYRSVGAVLLVHRLEHLHVLLLHDSESDSFRLPGGKCNHGEKTEDCLHRTLWTDLAPHHFPELTWRVQEYMGCWWQPKFTSKEMPLVLSQVSRPNQVSAKHFMHNLHPCTMFLRLF